MTHKINIAQHACINFALSSKIRKGKLPHFYIFYMGKSAFNFYDDFLKT